MTFRKRNTLHTHSKNFKSLDRSQKQENVKFNYRPKIGKAFSPVQRNLNSSMHNSIDRDMKFIGNQSIFSPMMIKVTEKHIELQNEMLKQRTNKFDTSVTIHYPNRINIRTSMSKKAKSRDRKKPKSRMSRGGKRQICKSVLSK